MKTEEEEIMKYLNGLIEGLYTMSEYSLKNGAPKHAALFILLVSAIYKGPEVFNNCCLAVFKVMEDGMEKKPDNVTLH